MKSAFLWKTRNLVALTRKDADAFSDALRAEYPAIRFLRADYWEPWIDLDATKEQRRLINAGDLPPGTPWRVMRHPRADSLHYLPSLEGAVWRTTVWIEPRGWRPRWSAAPNREGIYTIINEPRFQFEFTRSRYIRWHNRLAFDEPPESIPEDEILVLDCNRLVGHYRRDDKEHLAFLRRVWRILDKHATTELAHCDLKTLEPRGVSGIRDVWVGFDAMAWLRRDRRHYVSGGGVFFRPPEAVRGQRS